MSSAAIEKLAEVRAHRARFELPYRVLLERVLAGIESGLSGLELGAGDGQLGAHLNPALVERLTVTEPDRDCLPSLRDRYGDDRVFGAHAESLPFEDESFDYVLSSCVLDVVDNPASMVTEAARVLRPGGRLFHFLDMSTDLRLFFEVLADDGGSVALPNVFTEVLETEWPHDIFVLERRELEMLRGWLGATAEGRVLDAFLEASSTPELALSVYEKVNVSENDRRRLRRCFSLALEQAPADKRSSVQRLRGQSLSSAALFHARALDAVREAGLDVVRAGIERERVDATDDQAVVSTVGFVRSGTLPAGTKGYRDIGVHVLELSKPE